MHSKPPIPLAINIVICLLVQVVILSLFMFLFLFVCFFSTHEVSKHTYINAAEMTTNQRLPRIIVSR